MKKSAWKDAEVEILSANYQEMTAKQIGALIGRSASSVRHKAKQIGVSCREDQNKGNATGTVIRWTEEEVLVLLENYGKKDTREIAGMIGKKTDSVRSKSSSMGLPPRFRLLGVCVLSDDQEARYRSYIARMTREKINPLSIRKAAAQYVLEGKKDLDWLVKKATYQPDNYHLREDKKRRTSPKTERVMFRENPKSRKGRTRQLLEFAQKTFGSVRHIPSARQLRMQQAKA